MKKILILASLALALTFSGCAAPAGAPNRSLTEPAPPASPAMPSATSMSAEYAYEAAAPAEAPATYAEPDIDSGGYGSVSGLPAVVEARKVVYSADYYIATGDFDATMRRLEQKIAVNGGYIQQSDSRAATEANAAFASMTIRVPASMYGDFKTFLTDLAELRSSAEHGEDVTAQYFDTEARLKVLQAQEERIKTFIANSKDLDEIFKIERELARISTEIEQLTTVKNRLDNLTAYATIYVEVRETVEDGELEPTNFGVRVTQALQGSLKGFVVAAQSLLLLVLWVWPLLAVIAIILFAVRKFGKRAKKDKKDLSHKPENLEKEE